MRKVNVNQSIRLVILLGLGMYIFMLLVSGDLKNLVHPRTAFYIKLCLIMIMFMTALQLTKVFSKEAANINMGYMLLCIPVVLGLFIRPSAVDGSIAKNKGVIMSWEVNQIKNEEDIHPASLEDKGIISIDESNYMKIIRDMGRDPGQYIGRRVKVSGFVYRNESCTKDTFVIARMLLTCCAADSEAVGIPCVYNNNIGIEDGTWVSVSGVVQQAHWIRTDKLHSVMLVPAIYAEKVEPILAPSCQYVYP